MNKAIRLAGAVALLALMAPPAVVAQDGGDEPPAIRRVVFYKHGVGYFERGAEVSGDARLKLRFQEAQMKDVLKTLFAVDLDGGHIRSINYDSKEPLSKQLESIQVDIPPDHALSKFLGSLKGAPLTFRYAGEMQRGRIMGNESYVRRTELGPVHRPRLVILSDDGTIGAYDLFELKDLKLEDEALSRDLNRLLEISLRTKQLDLKEVSIRATGKAKDRRIRVGYLIEAPIWKTSYRLVSGIGEQPLLMGWAIVENPSEEDWQDVEMSFVSGNPLSFVLDLYTSYYPARPVLDVAEVAARPSKEPAAPSPADRRGRRLAEADEAEEAPSEGAGEAFGRAELEKSAKPAASGAAVGEMFAYTATEKVSIPAGRAAMVPILLEPLDKAEEVLYYKRSFSEMPAHAVWIKNDTSFTLESGPITFFEQGTAQGEGLLPRILKPGMEEVVPYALEPGVTVEIRVNGRTEPAYAVRFANGVMYLTYASVRTTVYRLLNETGEDRKLVLDHASASGYELKTPEADDRLPGHDRFVREIEAGAEVKLEVQELREQQRALALSSTSLSRLGMYLKQPYMSKEAREFLETVIAARQAIAELQRQVKALEEEARELERLQQRLRSNVRILKGSPSEQKMRNRYLEELVGSEERLQKVATDLNELRERINARERELAQLIAGFEEE